MSFGFEQAALDLMYEIDRIFSQYPFFGSRQIAAYFFQSMLLSWRCRVCCLIDIMPCSAGDAKYF
jgi:putative transposase